MSKRYTEDDLRAAFAAKAGEAPKAQDVLRGVRKAERPRRSRVRWLVPAVAAAAVAAVAVPLALSVGGSSSNKSNAGNIPAAGAGASSRYAASSHAPGGAQAPSGAGSNQAALPGASAPTCRPQDVTTTLTVTDATHATLVVTARAGTCAISRIPSLRWANVFAQSRAMSQKRETQPRGSLAAGASAVAPVAWQGCAPGATTARVDWGAGAVDVAVTGATPASCAASGRSDASSTLTIGAFAGLS